jgi:hypothetical protein
LAGVTQEALSGGNVMDGSSTTTTTYDYDANGNRTQQTQSGLLNGAQTSITTHYAYDVLTDLRQQSITNTLDRVDRLVAKSQHSSPEAEAAFRVDPGLPVRRLPIPPERALGYTASLEMMLLAFR